MRFTKSAIAFLGLIVTTVSQVIVTKTETITLLTVTVPPPAPTSTNIVYVTVNQPAPYTSYWTQESTVTVTITSQQPMETGGCSKLVADKGQCGGLNYRGRTVCEGWHRCYSVNPSYSQCQDPHSWRVTTIISTIVINKK